MQKLSIWRVIPIIQAMCVSFSFAMFACLIGCGESSDPIQAARDRDAVVEWLDVLRMRNLEIERARHMLGSGEASQPYVFYAHLYNRTGVLGTPEVALSIYILALNNINQLHLIHMDDGNTSGEMIIYRPEQHLGGVGVGGYISSWTSFFYFRPQQQISLVPYLSSTEVPIDWKNKVEVPIDTPTILTSRNIFLDWFRDGKVYIECVDADGGHSNMLKIETSKFDFTKIPERSSFKPRSKPQGEAEDMPDELYWNALFGRADTINAALSEDRSVARRRFRRGQSLLHQAARSGHRELAMMLIDHGADPNQKDVWGDTPLHMAARSGHQSTARSLVELGARPNSRANDDRTPLHDAAMQGFSETVRFLLKKGAENSGVNSYGTTPLHACVLGGHLKAARILVQDGAGIDAEDKGGHTPLALAAKYGHEQIVEYLIRSGAGIDAEDNEGFTPIALAVTHGHEKVVKHLLRNGADAGWTDRGNRGLTEIAESSGHEEIAQWIRSQLEQRSNPRKSTNDLGQ